MRRLGAVLLAAVLVACSGSATPQPSASSAPAPETADSIGTETSVRSTAVRDDGQANAEAPLLPAASTSLPVPATAAPPVPTTAAPPTPTSAAPPTPTTAALPTPDTAAPATGTGESQADTTPGDVTATAGCRAIDPLKPGGHSDPEGAHAFSFTGFDGSAGSLSGYAGCGLMINFFASWCSPCVAEMPDFEEFWQRHGHQVAVLGLARNDTAADALQMIATTGVTYPTGVDSTDLFITLGGLGMPTTVFISPEGAILDAYSGLMTPDVIFEFADRYFGPLN